MLPIRSTNFKSASLKQKLFNWRDANSKKSNNKVFQTVMSNEKVAGVLNQEKERKAFLRAINQEGVKAKGKGISKNTFRKILGAAKGSGLFDKKEMHILGEELVGGNAAKRVDESVLQNQQKEAPHSDMRKMYNEVIKKGANKNISTGGHAEGHAESKNSSREESKVVTFSVSNKNFRDWQQHDQKNAGEYHKSASVEDYIAQHQPEKIVDDAKVKSLLASIQGENDEDDSDGDDLRLAA